MTTDDDIDETFDVPLTDLAARDILTLHGAVFTSYTQAVRAYHQGLARQADIQSAAKLVRALDEAITDDVHAAIDEYGKEIAAQAGVETFDDPEEQAAALSEHLADILSEAEDFDGVEIDIE